MSRWTYDQQPPTYRQLHLLARIAHHGRPVRISQIEPSSPARSRVSARIRSLVDRGLVRRTNGPLGPTYSATKSGIDLLNRRLKGWDTE